MMTKDFLKLVLVEDKRLIKLSEVKFISIPHYSEMSVKVLWPHLKNDKIFMQYFPDRMPVNHLPDRSYFFNILNSTKPEYLKQALTHANKQKNSIEAEKNLQDSVLISDSWWTQLNEIPFISCKFTSLA